MGNQSGMNMHDFSTQPIGDWMYMEYIDPQNKLLSEYMYI